MQEQAGTLQMFEEADAQAGAVGGALDETGDVGDDEALVLGIDPDDAEVRVQGGEGVVGDLRPAAESRSGAFAGVGQAEKADVGEYAQFEHQFEFLAGLALGASGAANGWCSDLKWICRGRPGRPLAISTVLSWWSRSAMTASVLRSG